MVELKYCNTCDKNISRSNWSHHVKTSKHLGIKNNPNLIYCSKCHKNVSRHNWTKHTKTKKHMGIFKLKNVFNFKDSLFEKPKRISEPKYRKLHRVFNFSSKLFEKSSPKLQIVEVGSAFKSRLQTYHIQNTVGYKDASKFLDAVENIVNGKLKECLKKMNLKANILLLAQYKRGMKDNIEYHEANFKTENEVILSSTNLKEFYSQVKHKITTEMESFEARGSQWNLNEIYRLELRVNKYTAFRGSSFMPLPKEVAAKMAIINIQNDDTKCFLWSVLAHLHPVKIHAERVSHYRKYEHELDEAFKDIEFPVKITDIDKFEKRANISVNVFHYESKSTKPLRITKEEKPIHVNLLFLKDKDTSHYCLITDLWRLIGRQVTAKCGHREVCPLCMSHFANIDLLNKHKTICSAHKPAEAQLPKPYDNELSFKNWNHSLKVPFVIYADFECMLSKVNTCQPPEQNVDANGKVTENSYTNQYQKHEPISFCYYIKYQHEDYKAPVEYFGEDAAKQFYKCVKEETIKIGKIYENPLPMIPLQPNEMYKFTAPNNCHICEKSFSELPPILDKKLKLYTKAISYFQDMEDEEKISEYKSKLKLFKDNLRRNMRKVMDHDHLSGKFRGPAHSVCNINYRNPKFVPVFFHNLSGYDAHLFIKQFGDDARSINLIPNTEEKYISFSKALHFSVNLEPKYIQLRFIDSFRFLSSSLETLAGNLNSNQFTELAKFIERDRHLVTKKLAYPYEYMDSKERYNETKLPAIECFYSRLNNETVKPEEYENAEAIWKAFNIKTMREFTQFYNKIDVLLLADIMENFRELSLETYKLDPAWYFTTPGFAWDAMLRKTQIQMELLTDIDMFLMVESGIRGGITQCSKRYAKANNKYMNHKYDPKKETVYLGYFDANNEYGWSMCKYLPYSGFEWCDTNIDVTKISDESDTGYILEVDLEYPDELHDAHNDFPLAPENKIGPDNLPKLMTTLYNKNNYVVHYMNLKYYLQHGLKLTKIHRVLKFKQSPWLKNYIDLNTQFRSKAKNDFEKDFYKLMNNAVFGKTMENIRNRVNIKLCSDSSQIEKLIAKPNFKDRTLFTEKLAALHFRKTSITLNKPIYVGMSILETSKLCLYGFWYDVLKPRYGDRISLLYEDTDSQIFAVKTEDFYQDMKEFINELDTSDYPEDNEYNIPRVNKKVLGKFKDELNGTILEEAIGLRAKCYALNTFENNTTKEKVKKIKGIKKSVVKNNISFNDFRKCLFNKETIYRKQNLFRSHRHDIYTVEMKKKALSNFDDKRCILENGIDTLAWGHQRIGIEKENFITHLKNLQGK